MKFQVVCISRTIGAGGERIGQLVAERLGFRYVDEQIITRAARQAQVDPKLVAAAEHTQPLVRRVLRRLPRVRELAGPIALGTGLPVDSLLPAPAGYRATPDDLGVLIRAAIHEIGRVGRAVIVAHAASMALTGVEGVLRVLVTASPEVRSLRLAAAHGLSAAEAAAALAASDRERREYFRRFYHVSGEFQTDYDIVINSDVLTPDEAVRVIGSVC